MGEAQTQSNNQECKFGHEDFRSNNNLQHSCEDESSLNRLPSEALLQRIDRLDIMLSTIEDIKAPTEPSNSPTSSPRPITSRRHSSAPTTPSSLEKRRKPTESVLEEVQEKGTLVERISDLEKRVMTLQRMLSFRSHENPNASAHLTGLPHRRGVSHQEMYDQQFLQEPVDVEKHEVTPSHSNRPLDHKGHAEPLHETPSESPHVKHYEDMVSSGKASEAEKQDPKVTGQLSKKKKMGFRKWLSKQLHIHLPGTPQDKQRCSIGHCWGPKVHPKNCWNVRKRDSRSTPYAQFGHMPIDDESS